MAYTKKLRLSFCEFKWHWNLLRKKSTFEIAVSITMTSYYDQDPDPVGRGKLDVHYVERASPLHAK